MSAIPDNIKLGDKPKPPVPYERNVTHFKIAYNFVLRELACTLLWKEYIIPELLLRNHDLNVCWNIIIMVPT